MKIGIVFKEGNKDDFKIKSSLRFSSFGKLRTAGLKKAEELAVKIEKFLEEKGHQAAREDNFSGSEFILSLGGDGTLIHKACEYVHLGVPLIGINTGRLGFLTAAEADEWQDALEKILENKVYVSERMTIVASIEPKRQRAKETEIFRAVNECAIKGFLRAVSLSIAVNGQEFLRVVGDGVILSTQTGSTAYSLSSGGPIVDPKLDCLLLTPINPIGLPIPSVVLSPSDEVKVKILSGDDVSLVIDGQEHTKVKAGEQVLLSRGKYNVKFGYFDKHHFVRALNAKFGLAGRASQE